MMNGHKIRRYGDQAYCPLCGKSWDNKETEPECVQKKTPQQWLNQMRESLRKDK